MRTLTLFLLTGALCSASLINVVLINPNQTAQPGTRIGFEGSLSNPAGGTTEYINSDSVGLSSTLVFDDLMFLSNAPLSLDSPGFSGPFEFFTVSVPFGTPATTFTGSFGVLGGLTPNDNQVLGSANFTIQVTPITTLMPEPSTVLLVSPLLIWLIRRSHRNVYTH